MRADNPQTPIYHGGLRSAVRRADVMKDEWIYLPASRNAAAPQPDLRRLAWQELSGARLSTSNQGPDERAMNDEPGHGLSIRAAYLAEFVAA
jgi:hypothetical protein